MLSGIKGAGAEDGWYAATFELEFARLTRANVAMGATDLWKCFDTVIGGLVEALPEEGGCPKPIRRAWISFQENLWVTNQIAGGCGTWY